MKKIIVNDDINKYSWKSKPKAWGDSLHKICAYNAMFPVSIADYFIKKYSNINDIVLDPFSGRGTTLLQGRILNRRTFASDLNPLSFVLSKAKQENIDKFSIFKRIVNLNIKFNNIKEKESLLLYIDDYKKMRVYYSKENLLQLIFLREEIGKCWIKNNTVDNFILAIALGLMHGPAKKDGTSSYFSVSMSNGISMSHNYVKKFVKKNNLKYIKSNIFEQIRFKIEKIYSKRTRELEETTQYAEFRISNALNISKTWHDIKPKLIFTSPPYLNIINYTKQNWIKMWMLGFDDDKCKKIGLDDKHSENSYIENFLIPFMKECSKIMESNSKLIMIIGDVKKMDNKFSVINVIKHIEEKTMMKLEKLYIDDINQNKKSTNSLGSKSGRATQTDVIYVFSCINK